MRNHDPVRDRRRRPVGHGDSDVGAVIHGEDAVGVGVAAGIPLYFKIPAVAFVSAAWAGAAPTGMRLTNMASASRALKIFLLSLRINTAPFRAARGHEKQTHGERGGSTHGMRL